MNTKTLIIEGTVRALPKITFEGKDATKYVYLEINTQDVVDEHIIITCYNALVDVVLKHARTNRRVRATVSVKKNRHYVNLDNESPLYELNAIQIVFI